MQHDRDLGYCNALWRASLATLCLLNTSSMLAAEAMPVFTEAELDAPPALAMRALPRAPASYQPWFGARLTFEFVVDALGQTGEVTLIEAQPMLSETGKIVQESDLPALRRVGLLIGLPENASFREISDLLTKPFLQPGKETVLRWHYRPGRKAGVAVAARVTDSVVFGAGILPPPERIRPVPPADALQTNAPAQPYTPTAVIEPLSTFEPYRPSAAPEPTRSIIAVVPMAESGSTMISSSQAPTTVVAVSGGGSIILTPGQPHSNVVLTPGGGSTIYSPGQPPATIVPVSGTESIIFTPGQPQSTVVAVPGGGSTIYTPGQSPTTVVPIAGGGSIIYAPGQPPVTVLPNP